MKKLLVLIALMVPCAAYADDAGGGSAVVVDAGIGSAVVTGSGSATSVPTYTIDVEHPVQDAETAVSLTKQFGILWGSMIVLFGIGTFIVKQNDETHWLSHGHTLPIAVGVLGVLGSILACHFTGASWSLVGMAVMAVVTLIIQKPLPGKKAATS